MKGDERRQHLSGNKNSQNHDDNVMYIVISTNNKFSYDVIHHHPQTQVVAIIIDKLVEMVQPIFLY